jgi:chromatin remodeling complex protein RSC6
MPKPKIILDIAEKAFPKASEKVRTFFKKTYDDMRIDMSEGSAFEAAKKETREKIKIEPETKFKGGSIKKKVNKMFVGGIPDPSTIVSKLSAASPQDYIDYKTNTGSQTSTEPEERTGYKAAEFKTTIEEKPVEKSKGGLIYSKPHQKKYYGDLI